KELARERRTTRMSWQRLPSRRARIARTARRAWPWSGSLPAAPIANTGLCDARAAAASISISSRRRPSPAWPDEIAQRTSARRLRRRLFVREQSGGRQREAEHARQVELAIGLGEQQHAGIQPAVMDDGVFGIAGGEQHFQRRAAPRHFR